MVYLDRACLTGFPLTLLCRRVQAPGRTIQGKEGLLCGWRRGQDGLQLEAQASLLRQNGPSQEGLEVDRWLSAWLQRPNQYACGSCPGTGTKMRSRLTCSRSSGYRYFSEIESLEQISCTVVLLVPVLPMSISLLAMWHVPPCSFIARVRYCFQLPALVTGT